MAFSISKALAGPYTVTFPWQMAIATMALDPYYNTMYKKRLFPIYYLPGVSQFPFVTGYHNLCSRRFQRERE